MKCEQLDGKQASSQAEVIRLEAQFKILKAQNLEIGGEVERLQAEIVRTQAAKDRAEGNLEEVKEKMR